LSVSRLPASSSGSPYKAALVGIQVVTLAESHTSTWRFLDNEPIGHHDHHDHHDHYLGKRGKRGKRGLFVASTGQPIHADVHASYNSLRRSAPNVVANGASAFLLRPIPLRLPDRQQHRSTQLPCRKARK
jgi:hypothetical protein